jgi:hypothetical protein
MAYPRFHLRTLMLAVAAVALFLGCWNAMARWAGYRRQAMGHAALEERYKSAARELRRLHRQPLSHSAYHRLPDGAVFDAGWTTRADGTMVFPDDLAAEYDKKAQHHARLRRALLMRW